MKGFSLVELMVAVAIVGVLAVIAIPNYAEFAKKARHSEAKQNLSTLYTAEKVFQAEYNSYTSRFDALGYSANGVLWYNIGFDGDFAPPLGAPVGTAQCRQLCPTSNCAGAATERTCSAAASSGLDGAANALVTATRFTAGAHSHFTGNPIDWFTWTINESKAIVQIIPAN